MILRKISSSSPIKELGKKLGVLLPVLGLLGALLVAPRDARANSGNNFLETIGVSTAVGTVLGASTLPFYDSPGSNLSNLLYGASIGAVVGVGIWLVGLSQGSSQSYSEGQFDTTHPTLSWFGQTRYSRSGRALIANANFESPQLQPNVRTYIRPTSVSLPLVSLTW